MQPNPLLPDPAEEITNQVINAPGVAPTPTTQPAAQPTQQSLQVPIVSSQETASPQYHEWYVEGVEGPIQFELGTPEREQMQFLANTYPDQFPDYDPTGRYIPPDLEYVSEVDNSPGGRMYRVKETGQRVFATDEYAITNPRLIELYRSGRLQAPATRAEARAQMVGANDPLGFALYNTAASIPVIGAGMDEVVAAFQMPGSEDSFATLRHHVDLAAQASRQSNPNLANVAGVVGFGGGVVAEGILFGSFMAGRGMTIYQQAGSQMLRGGTYGFLAGGAEGALAGTGGERIGRSLLTAGSQGVFSTAISGLFPFTATAGKFSYNAMRGRTDRQIADRLGLEDVSQVKALGEAVRGKQYVRIQEELANLAGDTRFADLSPGFQALFKQSVLQGLDTPYMYKDAMLRTASAANQRVMSRVNTLFGNPIQSPNLAIKDLMQLTKDTRRQLYAEAYKETVDWSGEQGYRLTAILSRVPMDAWREARELAYESPDFVVRMGNFSPELRAALDHMPEDMQMEYIRRMVPNYRETLPEFRPTPTPSMQELDYIKTALYDSADKLTAAGATRGGASKKSIADNLADVLSEEFPAYRDAVDFAGGVISNRDAITMGREALTNDMSSFFDDLSAMREAAIRRGRIVADDDLPSEEQLDYYFQGIRSYIEDTMARTAAAANTSGVDAIGEIFTMQQVFSETGVRRKLQILIGEEQANALLNDLDNAFGEAVTANFVRQIDESGSGVIRRAATQLGQTQANADAVQSLVTQLGTYMGASQQYQVAATLRHMLSAASEPAKLIREQRLYDGIADFLNRDYDNRTARQIANLLRLRAKRDEPLTRTQTELVVNYLTKYVIPAEVGSLVIPMVGDEPMELVPPIEQN